MSEPQHAFGDASEQDAIEAGAPMGSDHDQIRADLVCERRDLRAGATVHAVGVKRRAARSDALAQACELLVDSRVDTVLEVGGVRMLVSERIGEQRTSVQRVHLRPDRAREFERAIERPARVRGEVDPDQDLPEPPRAFRCAHRVPRASTYTHSGSMHKPPLELLAAAVAIGALFLLACGGSDPARSDPNAQPARATGDEQPRPAARSTTAPAGQADIRDYMASHFVIALYAHDRLVEGDLEAIREPLAEFAAYRYDDVAPGSWMPWLARIQAAARIAAQAQGIETAASAVAAIARDCGACHEAHGARPAEVTVDAPGPGRRPETVPERMRRHVWGIDQLWRGLVSPSDAAWRAGAEALAGGSPELAPGESSDEAFQLLLDQLRALGQQALGVSTVAAREEVYATLLSRCAGCHARAEITPYGER